LSWTKVDSALDYTLYYKEASAKKFVQRVVVGTSTVWYGIKGKTYDFYLVANPCYGKGLKKSDASATKTILLDEAANPKQPLPTPTWTKHSVKNTEIKLEWSKVADALNYTLYYKEASAKKFLQRVVATNSTTYYGVKGKSYDFFVVANPKYNDGYEVSAASETKTILLSEAANPNQPLPTPTWKNVSVAKTKISLEWTKVDAALNYTLYYKEASAKKFFQRVVAGTSTTYYGVKGKSYDFFVVANPKYNDGYEVSAASETKTILVDGSEAPKQKLATPTWTTVSASKTKISLAWTEVADALNYSLFYKEATAKNYVKRIVAKTSTTYCGIKGKTYEFYVVANPKCGSDFLASDVSATRTITLDGNNGVNPPVDPNPTKTPLAAPVLSANVNGTTITVSWDEVDKARGYEVFWKVEGASGDYQTSNEIDGTSYRIPGVAGQTYEIYAVAYPTTVAATNGYRQSENSNTVTPTIPKQEKPPVGLTPLPDATRGNLAGSWNKGSTGYMGIFVDFQLPDGVTSRINTSDKPNLPSWHPGVYFAYQIQMPDGTILEGACGCHPVGSGEGLGYRLGIEDLPKLPREQPCRVRVAALATDEIKKQGYTHGEWSEPFEVKVGFELPGNASYVVDPSSFPDFGWIYNY